MILYRFPPLGGTGTLRNLGHLKHLVGFGWNPTVLTVQSGAKWDVRDETLMNKVPLDVEIFRTKFLDIRQLFQIFSYFPSCRLTRYLSQIYRLLPPDHHIGWLPFAYSKARKITETHKIDAIYTHSTPYSSHLIGWLLKKKTGIPWIADFGDEWTTNPLRIPVPKLTEKIDKWAERSSLNDADHIIIAWPGMIDLFPVDISNKATTLTCVFDENDFHKTVDSNQSNKFRIAYSGSFYGSQQPTSFLTAMEIILEEGKILIEDIELVFVGQVRRAGFVDFEETILDTVISRVGFVSHKESVRWILDADVLLLIVSTERGQANIPGKTFEYIASGKPILALVPPDGAVADLIRYTQTGVVVDPDNVEGIKGSILSLYEKWKKGELRINPRRERIMKYESKEIGKKLAETLENVSFGN